MVEKHWLIHCPHKKEFVGSSYIYEVGSTGAVQLCDLCHMQLSGERVVELFKQFAIEHFMEHRSIDRSRTHKK